ncbi:MAG TPA: SDR family NAD(P)-dependent oxidoreductase, partial [Acidimicrobiales bacterium]
MDDVLGYEGKKVVVTGAASGMGAATAALLVDLGAEVHTLDIQSTELAGATARQADLKAPDSIDAAVAEIGADVQAVFSVAGLPGPPFSDLETMTVFEAIAGKEIIDAFVGPSGRRCVAEEQAWPLLFLNSPRLTYVAAGALHVDG